MDRSTRATAIPELGLPSRNGHRCASSGWNLKDAVADGGLSVTFVCEKCASVELVMLPLARNRGDDDLLVHVSLGDCGHRVQPRLVKELVNQRNRLGRPAVNSCKIEEFANGHWCWLARGELLDACRQGPTVARRSRVGPSVANLRQALGCARAGQLATP